MRIHYCSDLHLEFGGLPAGILPKSGELLLLCGDITLIKSFRPAFAHSECRQWTEDFFGEALRRFDRVVFFPGNHEAYGDEYTDIYEMMTGAYPELLYLNNQTLDLIPGHKLFCSTLWTDLGGGTARPQLNDYRVVKFDGKTMRYVDTEQMHKNALDVFDTMFDPALKWVVATHHCPSAKCLNSARYARDGETEFGYFTDLEPMIKARPEITHWVCGHTHKRASFKVGKTQVLMNCRGYVGREKAADTFRLRSFKIGG